ncbi:MAG: radical SAM protein [bacterium]|nr:radical SAM protein [bacterium]
MLRPTSRKLRVFLGDLAYFNSYTATTLTIPLNVGYMASYVEARYPDECDIRLFKDPERLIAASKESPPDILGLSCYFWNERLDVLVAQRVKAQCPDCVVAIGGPSVDTDVDEQRDLFETFDGAMDYLIVNEGECGFAALVGAMLCGKPSERVDGCVTFADNGTATSGEDVGLSLDLESLPSPILGGILDDFLVPQFMPMIQTSRLCPYACAYCASGKVRGRPRAFPTAVVKDEVAYLAERYRDYPHRTFLITDDNFGLFERDADLAESFVEARSRLGYPRQMFCYFDKKFSPTVRRAARHLAEMNSGGLQLAFQSFSEDALEAVGRSNMNEQQMAEAVTWAHDNGLKVSSEMIFGLPHETKLSFLEGLERAMRLHVDTLAAHNLFLLRGIPMNREGERARHGLETRFRPSYACAHGEVDGVFVSESEEVVVGSGSFSFDDFMAVRKVALPFYFVNAAGYFREVFGYLAEIGEPVVPLFERAMEPRAEDSAIPGYTAFVADFTQAVESELYDSRESVHESLRQAYVDNDRRIAAPARHNVSFAARLIYRENWFGPLVNRILAEHGIAENHLEVLHDLAAFSEAEWIDLKNPAACRELHLSSAALDFLGAPKGSRATGRRRVRLSASDPQCSHLTGFMRQYGSDDGSHCYAALDVVVPRSGLRYDTVTAI